MRSIGTYIGICCAGFLMLTGCAGSKSSTTTVTHADDKATADKKVAEGVKLPKVVIKPFSSSGVTDDAAAGIEVIFCTETSKSKKIDLSCADDLKTLLKIKEDQIFLGECNEEDCLAKLGQRLNADYIVQCSINKVGETLLMSVNLFEGSTGKVTTRLSKDVPSGKPEDLLDVAAELAAKLIAEF